MKTQLLRGALFALIFIVSSLTMRATSILLYDDNTNLHNARTALDNLGLSYSIGNQATFNTLLNGSIWDLVVLDIPSNSPSFNDLVNYVDNGGKAILSYWALNGDPILAAAFDVTVASSLGTPTNVYSWDATHPIWNSPTSVSSPLASWVNTWGDDGDKFVLTGATMVGGFTATVMPNQGAIGIGNGGRTIVNGFLFDEMTGTNSVKLIENEITFVLGGSASVPDSGTTALLLGFSIMLVAGFKYSMAFQSR
jgi:hypothetical protein